MSVINKTFKIDLLLLMSDIFNKLNQLKGKLTELEVNIADEVRKEQTMGSYKERLEKKLPLLREMQRERVSINVGNEVQLITSKSTINNFPFKLSIKDEIKTTQDEIFVDSSESLFSGILEIIRSLSSDPEIKEKRKLIVTCNTQALEIHAKDFFSDDTQKVLEAFDLISVPFWTKVKKEERKKKDPNKWGADVYILCYSCGSQNDGTHWRKRCSYDRADDSYCIEFYIATCLTCDPSNTLTY